MSATFWNTATSNAFNTALSGNIGTNDTTLTLSSVAGLQSPGIITIDRISPTGTATPQLREYIGYTGIASTTLTGLVRGLGNVASQPHSSGAIVEETLTVTHWNDLISLLAVVINANGTVNTTNLVTPTGSVTLTNKTLTSPTINSPTIATPTFSGTSTSFSATGAVLTTPEIVSAQQSVVSLSGTTPQLNLNSGNVFTITLSGNTTFTIENAAAGQYFVVEATQGSGDSYTCTWFSTVTWVTAGATAPTQTTTSSGLTTYGFRCTGTNTYDGYLVGTQ